MREKKQFGPLKGRLGRLSFYSNNRKRERYCIKRISENVHFQIRIQNLPQGITETGIRNLLLSAGIPIRVTILPVQNLAFVKFKTWREAELAIRDLDDTPPYHLKVDLYPKRERNINYFVKGDKTEVKDEKFYIDASDIETDDSDDQNFWKIDAHKKEEIENKLKSISDALGYVPSIRLYQNFVDFQCDLGCASMGRGYTLMDEQRFVGGLQSFETSSKSFNLDEEIALPCEYCKSLTIRICGKCLLPYCSKFCLKSSNLNHGKDCKPRKSKGFGSIKSFAEESSEKPIINIEPVPLKVNCTVVISSYHTLQTVYVRQIGKPWEEKFCNLCNDVAVAALKGKQVKVPEIGLLCIAKYYEDSCFYRAEIWSIEEEKILVFFIDFGNYQETDLKDLKVLPNNLKEERKLATKVELSDVPDRCSATGVCYLNQLTAEFIPLIVKSVEPSNKVVLIEKDSNTNVNRTIAEYLLPSWMKKPFYQNLGENKFYYEALVIQGLEIGEKYDLIITSFDEEDFDRTGLFWVTEKDSDPVVFVKNEMKLKMMEWCDFLGDRPYLPLTHELCLAYERGEWHRCVNLNSVKTTCCLFFVDEGWILWVKTKYIRRMVEDLLEMASLAINVGLLDYLELKTNEENQSKVVEFLKNSVGKKIKAQVHELVDNDYYYISIPELDDMLKK